MQKYTIMFILNVLTTVFLILVFDTIANTTNEMIPFIGVILFGLLSLLSIVLRGTVWYKNDLAKRTMSELDRIEKEENAD